MTNDEYAIVKLTEKSAELLGPEGENGPQILMKLAKEKEPATAAGSSKKKRRGIAAFAGNGEFTEKEESLFEKLRALRAEIAREAQIPPYIVFSDKTLTHMCLVKPKTKAELLSVSGVGEFKYEKYGEQFLRCIAENVFT